MLWLSTLGVQDMEVFADSRVQYPDYADYVQVELGAYTRDQGASWYAIVRARRVLAGFDNADWELALPLGTDHAQPTVVLGDHRLTVLEVKWESTLPAELHARVWLQRTTTGEGMTKPPPQIPGPPPVPYT